MTSPISVLADAQFGIVRALRPYSGFETDYGTAVPANTPIMFTEGGEPLDALIEDPQSALDPNLVRGLSVPMGARIILWIPQVFFTNAADPPASVPYTWSFWWRYRTVKDFRLDRRPYHLSQVEGEPDTSGGGAPVQRDLVPAANTSTIYVQTEPSDASARVTQNGRPEDIRFGGPNLLLPLVPGGTGVIQQGVQDPAAFSTAAAQPLYIVHEISALGDELLIGVSRPNSPANWSFGSFDQGFRNLFGASASADAAVYVSIGSAP